jgi:hypothetical protein
LEERETISRGLAQQKAADMRSDDQVVLEATGNSDAIATLTDPVVDRVVLSNPSKTRAIADVTMNSILVRLATCEKASA